VRARGDHASRLLKRSVAASKSVAVRLIKNKAQILTLFARANI